MHNRLRFKFQTAAFLPTQLRDLAACPREVCWNVPLSEDQRAQGMPGARCARSLVCKVESTRVVTTVTPGSPGIPYAMVLTVSFALSPVIGLYCHRRRRSCLHRLDASVEASGPHDFAVRKIGALVFSTVCVHRIPSRVRDDRETPLCGTGWRIIWK